MRQSGAVIIESDCGPTPLAGDWGYAVRKIGIRKLLESSDAASKANSPSA